MFCKKIALFFKVGIILPYSDRHGLGFSKMFIMSYNAFEPWKCITGGSNVDPTKPPPPRLSVDLGGSGQIGLKQFSILFVVSSVEVF